MTLRQTSLFVITALGAAMVAASFFVSTGFLLIDEVIYMLSADTFRDTGSLIIENGYDVYGSEDLTWMELLSVGPYGLTPQYPVGSAVVGGFFIGLFDEHGFYVMNALAAAATLFVTRALALELFEDERVALGAILLLVFASYFTEYAFGLWPHMVSILSVTTSFWLFMRAARHDRPIVLAILSGLALGLGLLFRVDGVLLLPAIGLLGVLYAVRPVQVFVGGAIGLIPGLTAMAYANALKFGSWSPISYGGDYATEDPLKYVGLIALSGLGFVLTLIVRTRGLRPTRIWIIPVVVLLVAAGFLVPEVNRFTRRLMHGISVLIIDATKTIDPRPGVQLQENGTMLFWGLPKKALGQSAPWIGCLLVMFAWPWGARRRAIACVLILTALWMFPFLIRSWHGGLSLNMRYFLPVLPALCILTAWLLTELIGERVPRVFLYAGLGGFAASTMWALVHPTGIAGSHQILSTYVFLAICVATFVAGVAHTHTSSVVVMCACFGIGFAASTTVSDNILAQGARSDTMHDFSSETGRDVVFDIFARSVFRDPNQIFALPHWRNETADPDFVSAVLSDGYRVLMHQTRATGFVQQYPRFQVQSDVPIQGIPFQSVTLR